MSIFSRKKVETRQFFPHVENYFSSGIFAPEYNSVVDTAVSKISNTIAILPLEVFVHTADGSRLAFWSEEYKLLADPCVEETPTLFKKTLVRHLLMNGNAYLYKGNGWLQIVDPKAVRVARDVTGRKIYEITGSRGGTFTDDEIIHIPYMEEGYNGTVGRSPADIHKDIISQNNILNEYLSLYFKNGVNSKLIFELGDKFEPGKQTLNKLVQELNVYYNTFWSGSKNSGLPGIVPPGTTAKFLESSSNVQAQLDESLKFSEAQIYKLFNIPPEVIMSSENKYGSLEQKNADYLQSCIQPLCLHICESLQKGLNVGSSMFISFNYNGLLETDISKKQDRLISGFNNGLYTLNEVRGQMNLGSISNEVEGNTRVVSASLMPWTQDNIESILAGSKLKLHELENAGRSEVDVKAGEGHNPVGRDMLK